MKPLISIIAAIGNNRELGKDNKLLWNIPEDMKRFRALTSGHPVIMGRKTYESIGKPLPNRLNLIVSRNPYIQKKGVRLQKETPCYFVLSLEKAIEIAKDYEKNKQYSEIFIIGGGQIYREGIKFADKLYLTLVEGNFPADTFFPEYKEFKKEVYRKEGNSGSYKYTFLDLVK